MWHSTLQKVVLKLKRDAYYRGHDTRQNKRAAISRSDFYDAVWREAAAECGASVRPLSQSCLEISRGGQLVRVFNNTTTLDDPVTIGLAADKPLVQKLLSEAGLPIPEYQEFTLGSVDVACEFLVQHKVCVVKPAYASGAGTGVTTFIRTRRQMKRSAMHAAIFGKRLMIERQMPGAIVRMLYLDGQLLDAVHRMPPEIVGDGVSSVAQLIEATNRERLSSGFRIAQVILRRDLDIVHSLREQKLTLRAVLPKGETARVKNVVNDNAGIDNASVSNRLSPKLIELGRRATEVVGCRLAGVDVVIPDLSCSDMGVTILEVNTTPGYYYHYHTSGKSVRVAIPILEACLQSSELRKLHMYST